LRREKKARENGAVLGWDESNFLRLQSMLGGAAAPSMQWSKCIDFVPKFDFIRSLILNLGLKFKFPHYHHSSCHFYIKSPSVVLLEQIQSFSIAELACRRAKLHLM